MKSILIVDDSATMRKVIIMNLRKCGLEIGDVTQAENGQDALDKLKETSVDLVLTDINMPVMTGLEFIEAVQAEGAHSNLPIVVISTESGDDLVGRAMAAGAKGFIKKPFTPDSFGEQLTKYLV